jgi:hypothetical protein
MAAVLAVLLHPKRPEVPSEMRARTITGFVRRLCFNVDGEYDGDSISSTAAAVAALDDAGLSGDRRAVRNALSAMAAGVGDSDSDPTVTLLSERTHCVLCGGGLTGDASMAEKELTPVTKSGIKMLTGLPGLPAIARGQCFGRVCHTCPSAVPIIKECDGYGIVTAEAADGGASLTWDVVHFECHAEVTFKAPGLKPVVVAKFLYYDFDRLDNYFPYSERTFIRCSLLEKYGALLQHGNSGEAAVDALNKELSNCSVGTMPPEILKSKTMARAWENITVSACFC